MLLSIKAFGVDNKAKKWCALMLVSRSKGLWRVLGVSAVPLGSFFCNQDWVFWLVCSPESASERSKIRCSFSLQEGSNFPPDVLKNGWNSKGSPIPTFSASPPTRDSRSKEIARKLQPDVSSPSFEWEFWPDDPPEVPSNLYHSLTLI